MIAAIGQNSVIGDGERLPWKIPADFGYFKRMTLGKPLIMGRKTFEGIGRPLPGRSCIVVTRDEAYAVEGALVASSLADALSEANRIAARDAVDGIMIGGGAQIYAAALELAERLYVTHVNLSPVGKAKFPPIDPAVWLVIDEPHVEASLADDATFRVMVYARRTVAAD